MYEISEKSVDGDGRRTTAVSENFIRSRLLRIGAGILRRTATGKLGSRSFVRGLASDVLPPHRASRAYHIFEKKVSSHPVYETNRSNPNHFFIGSG